MPEPMYELMETYRSFFRNGLAGLMDATAQVQLATAIRDEQVVPLGVSETDQLLDPAVSEESAFVARVYDFAAAQRQRQEGNHRNTFGLDDQA